jgi:Carboxypeptidase regulatory-like domain/TonB dependent receptor-like, beta-barrel
MRLTIAGCYVLFALSAFAQTDRGTITGTVSDPAGAVVPNAQVEAKGAATNTVFKASTTSTGNWTLASVPAGVYEISVSVSGFKKYVRPGVTLNTAETVRVDATLEVGATTDTITVNEEAPLLKTESGELSHQIDYTEADALPIFTMNGAGGGLGNVRDPLSVVNLLPGATQQTDFVLRINGMPSSSQAVRVEGQDATNGMWREQNQVNQQGVDAIQEVSIQTSNFAAEYGQAGGGYFNYTMKSGTNQYHGSGYDYNQNEAYNAGLDFTNNGNGGHIKNRIRRNDYGFTLGGPVKIPHLYDGKDKTFFFFNFEQFRQATVTSNGIATMPTAAYEQGNFAGAAAGFIQVCPAAGSQVAADGVPCYGTGTVFDPRSTTTLAGGVVVRQPFANQQVPASLWDPVAVYMQSTLFPKPGTTAALNNYNIPAYGNNRHTTIPSIKIDQALTSTMKLSGYFSDTHTTSPASNGFAANLAPVAPQNDTAYTTRINFDQTITPTLLLHLGIGLVYFDHPVFTDTSNFTAAATAAAATQGVTYQPFPANTYMPSFGGLSNAFTGGIALGSGFGAPAPGPAGFDESDLKDIKPTGNASLTWVRGNHTYKAGMELVLEGFPQQSSIRAFGEYGFAQSETGNPWENGQVGAFPTGFQYASFLMGRVDNITSSAITDSRLGNHSLGIFLQDNWKITHKLTLDYGLRWDYASLLSEQYGRMQNADFTDVNPAVGLPGSIQYEATCHCKFNQMYPFSIGPRLGVAYQLTPKTVIRIGAGISYSSSPNNAFLSYSVPNFQAVNPAGYGNAATQLSQGNPFVGPLTITYPSFIQFPYPISTAGCGPTGATPCVTPASPFISIDKGTGRLPRVFQWSIGIQREIIPNLLIEAAYVGNRGAWWSAPVLDAQNYNGLTPAGLAATRAYGATQGININNINDNALLLDAINNPAVLARFPLLANPNNVYPGFPATQTLGQALRPYPQWNGIPPFLGPPLGDTWYDSLQVKLTKRYSHGLTLQGAYTWAKELTNGANSDTSYLTPQDPIINNVYDTKSNKQISGFDQPQTLVISFSYTSPKTKIFGDSGGAKAFQWLVRDWTTSGVLKYASGMMIRTPPSNNGLLNALQIGSANNPALWGGGTTLENYVPGQSCLAVDPNSHFDPTKTLALNPAAWTDAGTGQYGVSAPYYNNCRWQRQPQESISLGRIFRVKEKYQLQIRMEFQNAFNRVQLSAPSVVFSGTGPQFGNPNGALSAGFGYVNTLNGAGVTPRSGQLVARFVF